MPKPDRTPIDRGLWRIAAVVVCGPMLTNIDATAVAVSLTTISRDLAAPLVTVQWVVSGYLLSLALALPLTGWLVDRVGAKRVYIVCFAAFMAASALCGLAQSMTMLIVARVAQGLAGGLMAPMAQMMIVRHAGPHVARLMGTLGFVSGLAPLLGPILAGFILQHASWRWIFLLNLPISIVAIGLAAAFLPKDEDFAPRRLDVFGLALISPGLVLLLNGATRAPQAGGEAWLAWLQIASGAALLSMFVIHSLRAANPLLDLRLLARRSVASPMMVQFIAAALAVGGQFLLPIYYLAVRGEPPDRTGLLLAPAGLGLVIAFPLVGRIAGRVEPRFLVCAGAVLTLLGTLPFAAFGATLPLAAAGAGLFVRSLGYCAMIVPALATAYSFVAKHEVATATTTLNVLQRIAGPIAAMGLAVVLQHFAVEAELTAVGVEAGFWCICAAAAVSALLALRITKPADAQGPG